MRTRREAEVAPSEESTPESGVASGAVTPTGPHVPGRGAALRARVTGNAWVYLARLAIVVVFLAVWEVAPGNPNDGALIDEFFVGSPSRAWSVLYEWISTGVIFGHAATTLIEMLSGFAIGAVGGMFVGVLLGVSPRVSSVFYPFVLAAYSTPRLALTPLLILWFGLGMLSKVALSAIIVFFLVFFSTYTGVKQVDQDLVNVLRVMDASRWQIHRVVTIPSAAAYLITGIRISVSYAFVGAVVGEILAGNSGLGSLISRQASAFNPSGIFAAIAVVVLMALIIQSVVTLLERRTLRWRTTDGATGPDVAL